MMTFREMYVATKLTQKGFSKMFGIPLRTIEAWAGGKRTPPHYVLDLIEYRLRRENLLESDKSQHTAQKDNTGER